MQCWHGSTAGENKKVERRPPALTRAPVCSHPSKNEGRPPPTQTSPAPTRRVPELDGVPHGLLLRLQTAPRPHPVHLIQRVVQLLVDPAGNKAAEEGNTLMSRKSLMSRLSWSEILCSLSLKRYSRVSVPKHGDGQQADEGLIVEGAAIHTLPRPQVVQRGGHVGVGVSPKLLAPDREGQGADQDLKLDLDKQRERAALSPGHEVEPILVMPDAPVLNRALNLPF